MADLSIAMLNNFISSARSQKSSEILKSFLRLIIYRGGPLPIGLNSGL
jgi:hypothetical protein